MFSPKYDYIAERLAQWSRNVVGLTYWNICVTEWSDADHDLCSTDVLRRLSCLRHEKGTVSLLGIRSHCRLTQSGHNV